MKKLSFLKCFVETLPVASESLVKTLRATSLLGMMLLAPMGAGAQVTVGSGKTPENFSVLELISNNKMGLRLPQLTTAERDAVQATFGALATTEAEGLTIFNTDTKCVETWNGGVWLSTCDATVISPKTILCGTLTVPIPVFMPYNLGADPTLDTPKKQMAYLSTASASTTTNNGRVYGGRYQWGRANLPYAINTSTYALYAGTTNAAARTSPTYDTTTGQILTNNGVNASTLHIFDDNADGDGVYDWRITTPNQQVNILWDTSGGVQGASSAKSANDPCPNGWRVPTQEEWERLGEYDCNPTIAGGDLTVPAGGVYTTQYDFVWVRAVCSGGTCTVKKSDWVSGDNSGYAVYRASDWNAAGWDNTGNLLASNAPEPFLFLPAAGFRYAINSGTVNRVGTDGFYWSSTVNGRNAHNLVFNSTSVQTASSNGRAGGFSLRCVSE